jgi:glycogen operon protein
MSHPPIRRYSGSSRAGYPEISSWLDHANGKVLWVCYAGLNEETGKDDIVLLCVNVYWEAQAVRLPDLPPELCWEMAVDTSLRHLKNGYADAASPVRGSSYEIADRSVMVFTAVPA